MKNTEILKNLDRCLKELNNIIVTGFNDEWDDDTLDALECVIDSLNYNYKEMRYNASKTKSSALYGTIANNR